MYSTIMLVALLLPTQAPALSTMLLGETPAAKPVKKYYRMEDHTGQVWISTDLVSLQRYVQALEPRTTATGMPIAPTLPAQIRSAYPMMYQYNQMWGNACATGNCPR